jgi:hypothetical protein
LFDLFDDGAHERGTQLVVEKAKIRKRSGRSGQDGELAGHGGFIDVVAHADAQAGNEIRVRARSCSDRPLVFPGERGFDRTQQAIVNRPAVLDQGAVPGKLAGDQSVIVTQHRKRLPRRMLSEIGQHSSDAFGRDLPSLDAEAEELTGELLGLLARAHVEEKAERRKAEGLNSDGHG